MKIDPDQRTHPQQPNACGGYALASVLPGQVSRPEGSVIYAEIQAVQVNYKSKPVPPTSIVPPTAREHYLSAFVLPYLDPVAKSTVPHEMNLPSAIAIVASKHNCSVKVCCNQKQLEPKFKKFGTLYADEIASIKASPGVSLDEGVLKYELPKTEDEAHLVLVNLVHWVAVDRDGSDNTIYDPGSPDKKGSPTIIKAGLPLHLQYSDLYIELRAKP